MMRDMRVYVQDMIARPVSSIGKSGVKVNKELCEQLIDLVR